MEERDKIRLTYAWIAYMYASRNNEDVSDTEWANGGMIDITFENPELCWELVHLILETDSSNCIMEVLSAGPLEYLLSKHGMQFIDRVEAEAKQNPLFASLLGGVWRSEMTEEIWDRVQSVWDRRGWDGNPTG